MTSNECDTARRLRWLAISHFALATFPAVALMMGGLRSIDSVPYAFSLLVMIVFAAITGAGLWRRSQRAIRWSIVAPFAALPLWVIPGAVVAAFVDFFAHGLEGTHGCTPSESLLYAAVAAAILFPFWLSISILYWLVLRRCRAIEPASAGRASLFRGRVLLQVCVALIVGLAVLVNIRVGDGQMLIHNAASGGHTRLLRMLLALGGDVDEETGTRWTPLHYAASSGRLGTVRYLLQAGADIDARAQDGSTAAILSAARLNRPGLDRHVVDPNSNYRGVLEFLVKKGADLTAADADGNTVLIAVMDSDGRYDTELAHSLVAHGAPPNAVDQSGESLVSRAIRSGNVNELDYLLTRGGKLPPDAIIDAGMDVLPYLVRKGLDVNAKRYSETRLHAAVRCKDIKVTRFLLAHGADVDSRDSGDSTPLFLCKDPEIARGLLKAGASINARNRRGRTPLHQALRESYGLSAERFLYADFLIQHGADVNARDNDGETLLHYASEADDGELVEFLLSRGADD